MIGGGRNVPQWRKTPAGGIIATFVTKNVKSHMSLKNYHYVWLSAHPERTEEWLAGIIAQGFNIHHMDGDHDNNDPKNLVLIEAGDHMMIHNGVARMLWKPNVYRNRKPKKSKKKEVIKTVARIQARPSRPRQHVTVVSEEVKVSKDVIPQIKVRGIRPTFIPELSQEISTKQRVEIAEFHKLMKMKNGCRNGVQKK